MKTILQVIVSVGVGTALGTLVFLATIKKTNEFHIGQCLTAKSGFYQGISGMAFELDEEKDKIKLIVNTNSGPMMANIKISQLEVCNGRS